ncbi:hypothetical protein GRR90_07205 [Lactococcus lactis subsp. lactis]|jgi:hypothetical protein|nr:hypothetical protein [Lactococcus lactis subsp. lactis]MBR8682052.1 hypothetical protein [Lactococcus lactis subsp. lactis]MBR8687176.1 hypothetical protein [Lactococcus lactis subsp. lactis]
MKFIKMDVISTEILPIWWVKSSRTEVRKILIVNESKAPKLHIRLKRGGKK